MENEKISVWNKKQSDLTMKDNLKVAVGITVAFTVVPVVVVGVASLVGAVLADRKAKKLDKEFGPRT